MHISRKIQQYFANLLVQNPKATVAVNMEPVHGPWGGSSVFIRQLTAVLRQLGFIVRFDLRKKADGIKTNFIVIATKLKIDPPIFSIEAW